MQVRRHQQGFTIIELMLVVAIIGALSAIAVPSFLRYQLRAKRSEAYSNLAAVAKAEESYFATNGLYADTGGSWPGGLSASRRQWTPAAETAFSSIGFRPEGSVYFDYDVNSSCGCSACFTATAYGDVDGNAAVVALMYVRPPAAGAECPSGVLGFATPVDGGSPVFNQVAWNTTTDDF
ncbi:Fimbrial protein [Myxococcaceae bacterium]|jgi:type IV pilus assembly protein PilA|nr:Fimbrial protein [Myxococcaceae bacterium]